MFTLFVLCILNIFIFNNSSRYLYYTAVDLFLHLESKDTDTKLGETPTL